MITYTVKEFNERYPEKKPKTKWGGWSYDPKTFYLTHLDWYPVDLTTKNSNSELLDLIFQINTKDSNNWDSDCVSDLIKAIDDIFYPQANCCSCGVNMKFSAKELCKKYSNKIYRYCQ
jgi:hypothetical protein